MGEQGGRRERGAGGHGKRREGGDEGEMKSEGKM